jgi:hypothetical protein
MKRKKFVLQRRVTDGIFLIGAITQKTMSQILRFWYTIDSTLILRIRRINENRHTPSAYVFLLWFHESDHWFYVSGVFYLKNNFLARPRFEPATAQNTFQHKNTKPQPSVLVYSFSWKLNNILDLVDSERREEYVLADEKSATWFFEWTYYFSSTSEAIIRMI